MRKSALSFTDVLTTTGILLVGYVFIAALADLRRYIRISTT